MILLKSAQAFLPASISSEVPFRTIGDHDFEHCLSSTVRISREHICLDDRRAPRSRSRGWSCLGVAVTISRFFQGAHAFGASMSLVHVRRNSRDLLIAATDCRSGSPLAHDERQVVRGVEKKNADVFARLERFYKHIRAHLPQRILLVLKRSSYTGKHALSSSVGGCAGSWSGTFSNWWR
jgi:hypothetical protein